jgi:hypothetical protein
MGSPLANYLSGMVTAGYLIAGLFFTKFWARSRDHLFAAFAAAFWLLALNQFLLTLSGLTREERGWSYLLRLAAFILLAIGIVYKNAARRRGSNWLTRPD